MSRVTSSKTCSRSVPPMLSISPEPAAAASIPVAGEPVWVARNPVAAAAVPPPAMTTASVADASRAALRPPRGAPPPPGGGQRGVGDRRRPPLLERVHRRAVGHRRLQALPHLAQDAL